MKTIIIFLSTLLSMTGVIAQTAPFELFLQPMSVSGLGGLQAFAFGQHQGKWLLVGGRLDGLHLRQPFASFDVAGHNNQLWVVDPVLGQSWTSTLSSLPDTLQEQLSSTNMEFHQEGDYLYLIGGYGYSETQGDHVTYDHLIAIQLPGLIDAIVNGHDISPFFRQITDPAFAVTGGYLQKIYDTYYLVGGNRFDGRYNPMGHATYTQVYTEQVRRFRILDNGQQLSIQHLSPYSDPAELHRRDFNVVAQIMPNGEEGLTAFSGVFQPTVDLPFLNAVNIDSSGYSSVPNFSQYYNHYHCGHLPVYSASNNQMHTVFFGGIAQYYEDNGMLVQDNNVPFVKTIARVSRESDGSMTEYKLPIEMPALMGASSEFIPSESLVTYPNGVIKLDSLPEDSSLVGYIFGGINSSALNIFWSNNGSQSVASNQILKVFLMRNQTTAIDKLNDQSRNRLQLQVLANPSGGSLELIFQLKRLVPVQFQLFDIQGRIVQEQMFQESLSAGKNHLKVELDPAITAGTYVLSLQAASQQAAQKIVLRRP